MDHEELDHLKRCISVFEQLCGVLDHVGLRTDEAEYVEDGSFFVNCTPPSEALLLTAMLMLPAKSSARVVIQFISGQDLDSVPVGEPGEAALYLMFDKLDETKEEQWLLKYHPGRPEAHDFAELRSDLGLATTNSRIIPEHQVPGVARSIGKHYLKMLAK